MRDEGPGLRLALGHDFLRGEHDPAGGGSGLGLHISARLIHREGGELDLRTVTDPLGCLATVWLPAVAVPRPRSPRPPEESAAPRGDRSEGSDRPEVGRSGAAPTR